METLETPPQLCERWQVSDRTLRRLMVAGLPYLKIGRSIRFDRSAVEAWLKEQAS